MKAHQVKNQKVRVTDNSIITPPASLPVSKGDVITLLGTDGMYCSGYNADGEEIYISVTTNVEIVIPVILLCCSK